MWSTWRHITEKFKKRGYEGGSCVAVVWNLTHKGVFIDIFSLRFGVVDVIMNKSLKLGRVSLR